MSELQRTADDDRIELRRAEAIRLRVQGKTFREIAKATGVSLKTAHNDVRTMLEDVGEESAKLADDARGIELERLDRFTREVMDVLDTYRADPDIMLKAVDRGVKVSERRAKLLGLDAPVKQEVKNELMVAANPITAARLVREAFGEHARPKDEVIDCAEELSLPEPTQQAES